MRRHGRATSVNFHAMATCLPIRCEWLISIGERMSIEMQSTNLWSSSVPRLQANSFPLSLLFCLRFLHHPPLSFLTEISGDCPLASRLTLCFSLYFWIFAIRLAYFSNLKKTQKKCSKAVREHARDFFEQLNVVVWHFGDIGSFAPCRRVRLGDLYFSPSVC